VDETFNAETGINGWVHVVTPLAGGKLLIAGEFTKVQGVTRPGIAQLNGDGSLDETFSPPQAQSALFFSQVVQTDGEIVAGGYDSSYRAKILRFKPDGTIDASFAPPNFDGQVTKLLLQPDGKIVVGGQFASYYGAPGDTIFRLNSDGSVDSTFNATAFAGQGSAVAALRRQSDGKLLVSRWLSSDSPQSRRVAGLFICRQHFTGWHVGK
jgi:uncharacterized delta-60 repeat protein